MTFSTLKIICIVCTCAHIGKFSCQTHNCSFVRDRQFVASWACLVGAVIFKLDQTVLARGCIWLNFQILLSSSANVVSGVRVNLFSTIYRLHVVAMCSLRKKFTNCSSTFGDLAPKKTISRMH